MTKGSSDSAAAGAENDSLQAGWWRSQPEHGPATDVGEAAVRELAGLLESRAPEFAARRLGSVEPELRLGTRGLTADEADTFLRAIGLEHLTVDEAGYIVPVACRPKPGGGRYALFSANSSGGDTYVSLNTEYLVHMGAASELVHQWGWSTTEIAIEVGEFDAQAEHDGRVVLAMEAKARTTGPDGLSNLFESLVRFAADPTPPDPTGNHSRKYVELLRLTESGPVALWLVSSGSRWPLLARRVDDRLELRPIADVRRQSVLDLTSTQATAPASTNGPVTAHQPSIDHAGAVARLTEIDGAQRVYEFPWHDEAELRAFITDLKDGLGEHGLVHARPWVWRSASTDGHALTPCGHDTGLELRFSYYA